MSLKITHKNSTAAGTPPAAGDIDVGELAINAADAELYTKDLNGNIRKFQNTTTGTASGVKFTQAGSGAVQRTVDSKLKDVVSVKDFGAVGDGVADDTVAIQTAIDTVGANGGGTVALPAGVYLLSADVSIKHPQTCIKGTGWTTKFTAASGSPLIKCILADRVTGSVSIENVCIENFACDGVGIYVERFTRGCVLRGVQVENYGDHGIRIKNSWSYILEGCRVKDCVGNGIYMEAVNNSMAATGNQVIGCAKGWVVENAQGGMISGNASEYNLGTNFECSANGLSVINNYFEGFDGATTGSAGQQYCVVLGAGAKPFHNCLFFNYVNGGSVTANSFDGDGVKLTDVRESYLGGSFSLSTRYPFAFDESDTVIGNSFVLSFDSQSAETRATAIRNLTANVSGGAEVLRGTAVFNNNAHRTGSSFGIRRDRQIKNNATTGSIAQDRIVDAAGAVLFNYGKLSSSLQRFDFDGASGSTYRFAVPLSIAGQVGFYGSTPTTQRVVSGSRGGNAALESLLTGLAAIGLITDNTTA
jgi:hypothetical protein